MREYALRVVLCVVATTARGRPSAMSAECRGILDDAGLAWLAEPFDCSAMKTSSLPLILGSGVGDTGTRSVAAAVDAFVPTCHRHSVPLAILKAAAPDDLRGFGVAGAWFDTPLATVFPRLACAFPDYKVVHTTRADYHRDFGDRRGKCSAELARKRRAFKFGEQTYGDTVLGRCLEFGAVCPAAAEARAAFLNAEADVRAIVPPDRLLVMNLSEGLFWEPLARFLGADVPAAAATRTRGGARGAPLGHSHDFFCHAADGRNLTARSFHAAPSRGEGRAP